MSAMSQWAGMSSKIVSPMRKQLRQWFVTGLLTLIPLIATIWILKVMVVWTEDFFLGLLPLQWHPGALLGRNIPGVGLVVTLVVILAVGMITRLYLVSRLIHLGERTMARIPIARGVYPGIKRLMQLFVGDPTAQASRVVLVPFPHSQSFAYAFVTGEQMLQNEAGTMVPHLRVFMPTTPNPTTGFLMLIEASNTRPTTLRVEEASKLIVSGGLV